MKPLYLYRPSSEKMPASRLRGAPARIVECDGRRGLNFTGARGRLVIPQHTLNAPAGSVAIWVMALEDLFPRGLYPQHKASNAQSDKFVFLTDREAVSEVEGAYFTLCYHAWWHPVFYAKFFTGPLAQGIWRAQPKARATAGHFEFEARHWYQLVLTWDHRAGRYRIYANGELVAGEDVSHGGTFEHDACGELLYAGNPALAYSEFAFYDRVLSPEEIVELHRTQATCAYPELAAKLARIWGGRGLARLPEANEPGWRETLNLSLREPAHLEEFYLQGGTPGIRATPEGLRVTTPGMETFLKRANWNEGHGSSYDMTRMYLWTHRVFEGDLHASFEFQLHSHGGLCLFMAQAAGMQGEDFLADYTLRVDGSMRTVCWEDVRNYHWEFYREMCDVRNDRVSHAMLKNPWYRPVAFQIEDRRWETGRWYRFDYKQIGARIQGAIDGVQVIDALDSGFDNNGPVLRRGRIALRCMMRTDMTFRNLVVRSRADWKTSDVI